MKSYNQIIKKKKKTFTNFFFIISVIFLLISLFYFDKLDFNKIRNIFTLKSLSILFLLIILKLLYALLFFNVMQIINNKKISSLKMISIFLQGGIVSIAVPGVGLLYKYEKLKNDLNIKLSEYTSCQTISTLLSIFSYLILAILFGFLKIQNTLSLNIFLSIIFIFFLIIFSLYKFRINILYFEKIRRLYSEFSTIKKTLFKNKIKLLLIFFGHTVISSLQCYAFYKTIQFFDFNLNFIISSYIYISSTIISFISLINFVGLFELALSFSASFAVNNYLDMILVGFSFRILNIASLFMATSIIYILNISK